MLKILLVAHEIDSTQWSLRPGLVVSLKRVMTKAGLSLNGRKCQGESRPEVENQWTFWKIRNPSIEKMVTHY